MKKLSIVKGYFLTCSLISTFMGVFLKLNHQSGSSFALIIGLIHFIGFVYVFFNSKNLNKI